MVDWRSMNGRLQPGFYWHDDIFEQPDYMRWGYGRPTNTSYQPAVEEAVAKWIEKGFRDGIIFFDEKPPEMDAKIVISEADYKKLI